MNEIHERVKQNLRTLAEMPAMSDEQLNKVAASAVQAVRGELIRAVENSVRFNKPYDLYVWIRDYVLE